MSIYKWIYVCIASFLVANAALAVHQDSKNQWPVKKHLDKKIIGYLEAKTGNDKSKLSFLGSEIVTLGESQFFFHKNSQHQEQKFKDSKADLIPIHYFPDMILKEPYIVLPVPSKIYNVGSEINLDASATVSPNGSPLKFKWAIYEPFVSPPFANPVFPPHDPALSESTISFELNKKGRYTVVLEVENSLGSSIKRFNISVGGSSTLEWSLNDQVFLDTETGKAKLPYIVLNDLSQAQRLKLIAGWKDTAGNISYAQNYAWRPFTMESFGVYIMPTFADMPYLETHAQSPEIVFRNPEWGGYFFFVDSSTSGVYLNETYMIEIMGNPTPTGPSEIDSSQADSLSWGLKNVNAESAWESSKGSKDVVIGVIDTGVNYLHDDLSPNLVWDNGEFKGINLIDGSTRPFDNQSHGTHCAGIIAGVEGNGGVLGIAPNISIAAYKALDGFGGGTILNLARAIYRAVDDGVDVISASWGLNGVGVPESELNLLKNAIEYAASKDVPFVVASGNDEIKINGEFDSIIPVPVWFQTKNMISVAATTIDDELASFSNYGNFVDVAAPGQSIISDMNANFKGIQTAVLSGTSMAAPLVAGIVGLMKSVNEDLSSEEIKNILIASSRSVPKLQGQVVANGIVDAGEAVKEALGRKNNLWTQAKSMISGE